MRRINPNALAALTLLHDTSASDSKEDYVNNAARVDREVGAMMRMLQQSLLPPGPLPSGAPGRRAAAAPRNHTPATKARRQWKRWKRGGRR